MKFSFLKNKIFLALIAAGCLSVSTVRALQVGNIYFIGDSLTDQGNCSVNLSPIFELNSPATNGNTYAFYFGQKFGRNITPSNNGGTDFACVTASTGYDAPFLDAFNIKNGEEQVQELLSTNPHFGSHDIFIYFLGANDIILSDPFIPPFYPAFNAVNSVNNVQNSLNKLHQAGSRYIVVLNLPPLEKTPEGMSPTNTPAQNAAYFNEPRAFNSELLNRLNKIGYNVIQIDLFSIFNSLISNPAPFGITNTTSGCSITPGQDCNTSFFFDGIHPTTKVHSLLADALFSILTAPDFYASLAQVPFSSIQANNTTIRQQLYPQQTPREIGKIYPFFGGNVGTSATDLGPDRVGYNAPAGMAAGGILSQINEEVLLGASLGQATNKVAYGQLNSTFSVNSTIFSIFASYQKEKFFINGVLNYAALRYDDIERQFNIGPVIFSTADSTEGDQEGASVETGYNVINKPNVVFGPIVTGEYQVINVDGYTENGADVFNIVYDDQRNTSFIGGLGLQATFYNKPWSVPLATNLNLTVNKQLTGGERPIYFHQASLAANFASLPVIEPTYIFALAGINFALQLEHGIIASLGDYATLGQNNMHSNLVAAGLTAPL